ncbi:MAG: hypothetical protein NTU41_08545 [Chloroflexi bacterium]|nr:hypothetical protein [Chloroflexota bacterium]
MTVLKEKLRDAKRESTVLGIVGAVMFVVGWSGVGPGVSVLWLALGFSSAVVAWVFGFLNRLQAWDLEWVLMWWGTRKR